MKKLITVFFVLTSILFVFRLMSSNNNITKEGLSRDGKRDFSHQDKGKILLPDRFETDEIIISNMDLGDRCFGENVFQADIQNKTEKTLYFTLDLRSEPKDGFTGNWQTQFIFILSPTKIKKISANYELRLINDESTVRITFNILRVKNNEIVQKVLFRKKYEKSELIEDRITANKQGVFTIKNIDMDDFCWGLNKFSVEAKNNSSNTQYLGTLLHTSYPESGWFGTKAGIYDAIKFNPEEEKTVEGEYFIAPEHGRCIVTLVLSSMLDNPETIYDRAYEIKKEQFFTEFNLPNQRINDIKMPQRTVEKFKFPQESIKPTLPSFEVKETEHFVFYYFPQTLVGKDIDKIANEREEALRRISNMISVDYEGKISVFFYPDAESKLNVVKHQGSGLAYDSTLVEIYNERTKVDPNHEICHIITQLLGNPPAMFDEGFAVYNQIDHKWKDKHIDTWAKEHKQKNMLWKIEDIFSFTEIGSEQTRSGIAYPQAASMVKYIIDKYGLDKFKEIYKTLKRSNNPEQIEINRGEFKRIIGIEIFAFEKEWLENLEKI